MTESGKDDKANLSSSEQQTVPVFPATVAKVLDEYTVVINRGAKHGINKGQRYLVYTLSDDVITDPTTNESLGYLEIIKGTGVVKHVQVAMATIESDEKAPGDKRIIKRRLSIFFSDTAEEVILPEGRIIPFEEVDVGDKARPI